MFGEKIQSVCVTRKLCLPGLSESSVRGAPTKVCLEAWVKSASFSCCFSVDYDRLLSSVLEPLNDFLKISSKVTTTLLCLAESVRMLSQKNCCFDLYSTCISYYVKTGELNKHLQGCGAWEGGSCE